jgi:alanine racemase
MGRMLRISDWLPPILRRNRDFNTYSRVEVSASALQHNLNFFRKLSEQQVIPVLKGNAYGHGIELVADAITRSKPAWMPYIAVDSYVEALRVRTVNEWPVLIMGAIRPENFKKLRYDNFAFVVSDQVAIDALGRTGKRLKLHMELNTGMNRYGCRPQEVNVLVETILGYPNLTLEGVMSHLADSDGTRRETVDEAVALFDETVSRLKVTHPGLELKFIHIAQTAGVARVKSAQVNTVRPGIGLYGINPYTFDHPNFKDLEGLRPALQVISTITHTQNVAVDEGVSYNYIFRASRPMKVGIIPFGYYEGLPRELSSVGKVSVGDTSVPIVGRVCMNHTVIDLSDVNIPAGENEVVVISNNPDQPMSIQRLCQEHQLFAYTFLVGINAANRRVLVE